MILPHFFNNIKDSAEIQFSKFMIEDKRTVPLSSLFDKHEFVKLWWLW